MKIAIIIPARFSSKRFPGKPLVNLRLPKGEKKSLIQLSWEVASKVNGVEDVFVATDDVRIKAEAESFKAKVIMTRPECRNGTERCAEAVKKESLNHDIFINFQGDAPLTPVGFVENLIKAISLDSCTEVVTTVLNFDYTSYKSFMDDKKNDRIGGTTAVFDSSGNALYFSKAIIPFFIRKNVKPTFKFPIYHHVGLYAFKRNALLKYVTWKEGHLEKIEGLEQLRFLENGQPIKCIVQNCKNKNFWELNNPEDIVKIEKILSKTK